jgi:methyl-accepting chemotaxis protein
MKHQRRTSSVAWRLYRLIGGFVVVLGIIGVLSYQTLSHLKVNGPVYAEIAQQKDLLADILPPPMYVIETYLTALQMVGESDPANLKEEQERIQSLKKDFLDRTEYWGKALANSPVRQALIEDSHKPAAAFFETLEKEFIPAIQKQDKAAATAIAYGKVTQQYLEHRKSIDNAVTLATRNSRLCESDAAKEIGRRTAILVAIMVGSLVMLGLYGHYTARALSSILKSTADQLSQSTEQMTEAAGNVSASSQSLAEGSSEQAASIQETSASLEELASMTKRNMENSQKANELAKQARTAADRGVDDMRAMSSAMDAIKVSSDDIAKIIKTIDEIAFQTNILALNAAVEAARAGESGMGFAVVADEVRNLAQRSAQAAKETAAKIEGAIGKTAMGVEINGKVAQALNDIVAKARQVDELAAEVANASREQTQGITQINTAVGQMDKVIQSNAANAEESAAAAEELNAQAYAMNDSVRELVNLVGGGQTGEAASAGKTAQTSEVNTARFKSLAAGNANGHSHHAVKTLKPGGADAPARTTGRSEIPLEDGFKDF